MDTTHTTELESTMERLLREHMAAMDAIRARIEATLSAAATVMGVSA